MCADFLKIGVSMYNKHEEKPQVYANPKYAENIFNQFYGFYGESRFTDFELNSCDHMK